MRPSSNLSPLPLPARPREGHALRRKSWIPACAGMSGKLMPLALIFVLTAMSGCSEYLSRRDAISPVAGDAVATDAMTEMVDPWPRASAQRNIGFDGQRMENAVQRYHTNRTYLPSNTGTSNGYSAAPAQPSGTPAAPAPAQPAAPTK